MRIALLGGSFDPPHMAHQMACLYLLEAEGFERVWLIPCHHHAFHKDLAPFEHRLAMCGLLARPFGGRVVVSEVEQALSGQGENRTIDTVDRLKAHHPDEDFTLVIGSDLLPELAQWKEIDRLRQELPFLVLPRPGHQIEEGGLPALPDVSSTRIRERLRAGLSVQGLLPATVRDYIQQHRLYRPPA